MNDINTHLDVFLPLPCQTITPFHDLFAFHGLHCVPSNANEQYPDSKLMHRYTNNTQCKFSEGSVFFYASKPGLAAQFPALFTD